MAGKIDVDTMLRSISAKQFQEWQTYVGLVGPFGSRRDDWRFAKLEALLANLLGRGKDQPAFKASDFLIQFNEAAPKARQTNEEKAMIVRAIAAVYANRATARVGQHGRKAKT